ncbi:Cof-type HAD-IIB family hydrolase [Calidithermus roseus]|uniref:Putative phosphatase n=1 Tax=Calidithermus roseus TaxID=1644118 RepID=A0A399F185_9DEIN|nr:Cof-type HAD-IIB family hydrolase [Calidithermus roseus]RIH88562.1 putative phosphatase [Calidithermus roseus]
MIRLVLIDVDGTLYGPGGVPECAWEATQKARAAGIHLALCTGRPGRGFALEYARRIDPEGLHIFESGAVVVGGNGQVVKSSPLSLEAYRELLALSRKYAIPFEVYTADGGFFIERSHPDLEAHQRMLGFMAEVAPLDQPPGEVIRVQYVTPLEGQWQEVRSQVQRIEGAELHEATSPGVPGIGFNSVTAAGVSKLSAARWVAERYGLGLERCAMVGDGENDLELILAAGLGIAMGNAPQSVKERSKRVVGRVEECGLAQALEWAASASEGQA